jgi:predicted DsbA family dithiol-disulfide isomerase
MSDKARWPSAGDQSLCRSYQDDLATAALADLLGVPPFVVDEEIEIEVNEDDETQ